MLFSVVICSYNRLDHLLASVTSALQQTIPADTYEVIVVDNASTDGTAQAIQKLVDEHPNLRYLYETRLGLATARNTGWQAAQGTYIAFLDDDAKAESNWLETAKELIERNPTNLRCVGGPIHPFYTSPKPDWWLDKYEIRTRGDVQRHLRQGEFFSGSNMIWLRETLGKYGGFEANAGSVAKRASAAGSRSWAAWSSDLACFFSCSRFGRSGSWFVVDIHPPCFGLWFATRQHGGVESRRVKPMTVGLALRANPHASFTALRTR